MLPYTALQQTFRARNDRGDIALLPFAKSLRFEYGITLEKAAELLAQLLSKDEASTNETLLLLRGLSRRAQSYARALAVTLHEDSTRKTMFVGVLQAIQSEVNTVLGEACPTSAVLDATLLMALRTAAEPEQKALPAQTEEGAERLARCVARSLGLAILLEKKRESLEESTLRLRALDPEEQAAAEQSAMLEKEVRASLTTKTKGKKK